MLTGRFLLGRARDAMSEAEKQVLEDSISSVVELPARRTFIRAGEIVNTSTLLIDGFICRYMDDRQGYRQLVALHVPGDFVDLHGYALKKLDHDVATIGPARVAIVEHDALDRINRTDANLTRLLWFSTLLDSAMHREWIFRLGRLDAAGRIAHLFCELEMRLEMIGLVEDGRFALPLTQPDLAEACGVTGVHTNRVLRSLRERGLMTFRDGVVTIHDRKALRAAGEFDGGYLYADSSALMRATAP